MGFRTAIPGLQGTLRVIGYETGDFVQRIIFLLNRYIVIHMDCKLVFQKCKFFYLPITLHLIFELLQSKLIVVVCLQEECKFYISHQ